MKSLIIALLNQKGGSGKTTLTNNLGMAFNSLNKNVLLVDADPQGSLRDWNDVNEGALLPVIGLDRETIPTDIKSVKNTYDVIIIDAAPTSNKHASAIIKTPDIILIPIFPSPYDVWASADILDLIKARQEITDGSPKAYFLINGVRTKTTLSNDVYGAIDDYGIPHIKHTTSYLEVYKQTAALGQTVFDSMSSVKESNKLVEIAKEILMIYDEK
jgi:chromosome partitioning protein